MSAAAGNGAGRRSLDAREQVAVARLVERAAHERAATTVEYQAPLHAGSAPAGGTPDERPDLVVACELGAGAIDWRALLSPLVARATKGLVLVVANPERLVAGGSASRGAELELARLLWELGRVRDRVYLVFPRLVETLGASRGGIVAPDVARAPAGPLIRRTAHLQGYVLDTAPRSPQARRRLRTATAQREPGCRIVARPRA
jgi:hypothetical protein